MLANEEESIYVKSACPCSPGLGKTVQWYLDNPAWWQRVLDGSYQGERLGVGNNSDKPCRSGQRDDQRLRLR
ncbi:hypothetical protein [Ectothiorhodospira haloalkaliphila]|nr:hypothetical protein [Ectothiorhodospira haloalkaliphila]